MEEGPGRAVDRGTCTPPTNGLKRDATVYRRATHPACFLPDPPAEVRNPRGLGD